MQIKIPLIVKLLKTFKFVVAIISIVATVVTIYAICKHNKLTDSQRQRSYNQEKWDHL